MANLQPYSITTATSPAGIFYESPRFVFSGDTGDTWPEGPCHSCRAQCHNANNPNHRHIECECKCHGPSGPVLDPTESIKQETHTDMGPQDLLNTNLSPEDRYARGKYLVDRVGAITDDGKNVLAQYLWEQNKVAIVAALIASRKAANQASADQQAAEAADEAVKPAGN